MKILFIFSGFLLLGLLLIGCDSVTDSKATSITLPELLLPENNKDSVSITPLFRWKNAGQIIEIAENSSFSNPKYSNDQLNNITQFILPSSNPLNGGATYFWRVGVKSGSTIYWSSVAYRFTTKP